MQTKVGEHDDNEIERKRSLRAYNQALASWMSKDKFHRVDKNAVAPCGN